MELRNHVLVLPRLIQAEQITNIICNHFSKIKLLMELSYFSRQWDNRSTKPGHYIYLNFAYPKWRRKKEH